MGEKDLSEKLLVDYNDVFADIVNGLIFEGRQVVRTRDLKNGSVHSQYKADEGKLHEQERDVLKNWTSEKVNIAICGIENQTKPDDYMPMRVLGYDGASYRSQLLKKNPKPCPVLTLVLYFGTDERWKKKTNLKSLFTIPKDMDEYINDYKINVFEIAWMSDEELNRFNSDFKIIANFLINKRKDKNYIPDDTTPIKHLDEVLKFLSIMTADRQYDEILKLPPEQKKGVRNMCSVADNLMRIGRAEGMATATYNFISKGLITPKEGAAELGISLRKLKSEMIKLGYAYPVSK